ncbi:MAG TPA: PilZ domain-containing protein [Stellaceae bacterium]|nr:PilZ domain-containing protein [Stellaceae bacterium]
MAAPPTHSTLPEADQRPSTPLSAVFRRLGAEPPAEPAAPPAPRPAPTLLAPQLLGFAEPVTDLPPIETFLPSDGESAAPAMAETAPLETAPPEPEPKSASEPEPVAEPPPLVLARVRNLVGRLGRLPEKAHPAEAAQLPAEPPPTPFQGASERAGRPSLSRNRRAYRRARLPAEIEISGVPCTLIDVSIGGFAASSVPPIEPNALVQVTIRLVIDGIEVGTQLSARIVYVTHGRSAGRFIDLGPSQMAFLRYIVTWRGESVGAVGTTTLLDAIAGGAERGFMPGGGRRFEPEGKSRWWAGLIGKKVNPPR